LIKDDVLKNLFVFRRVISDFNNKETLEFVMNLMRKYKTNADLISAIESQKI
ncbi:MAG: transcription termination factor Rho, partial [Thermotogae bacterium]|nr:transcription termination factor Rho [Thermotogota bacterium]